MKRLITRLAYVAAALATSSFFAAAGRADEVQTALSMSSWGYYNSLKPEIQALVRQDAANLAALRTNLSVALKHMDPELASHARAVAFLNGQAVAAPDRWRAAGNLSVYFHQNQMNPVYQQVAKQMAAVMENKPAQMPPGWTNTQVYKDLLGFVANREYDGGSLPPNWQATAKDITVLSKEKIPVMVNMARDQRAAFNPIALRLSETGGQVTSKTLQEAWKQVSDRGIPLIQNANSPANGRYVTTAAEEVAHAAASQVRVAPKTLPAVVQPGMMARAGSAIAQDYQASKNLGPIAMAGAAAIGGTLWLTNYYSPEKISSREAQAKAQEDARLRRLESLEPDFVNSEIGKLASVLLTKEDFEKFRIDYFHSKRTDQQIYDELKEKYSRHDLCNLDAADAIQQMMVWDADQRVDIRYSTPELGKPSQPYPVKRASLEHPNEWAKKRFAELNAPNQDFNIGKPKKSETDLPMCVLAKNKEALASIRNEIRAKADGDKRLDDLVADAKRREAFEASLGLAGSK